MPFVKLDCGMLNSTLWFEREAREVFITALLMAEPREFLERVQQIEVRTLDPTGWEAPPGWYGFVPAAGVGILHRARVEKKAGYTALETLGKPEDSSRSQDFEGRRLIRIDGGYIVLNYMKYRDRDYTAAERQRRYRERKAAKGSHRDNGALHRNITQAEAEAEVEMISTGNPDQEKNLASVCSADAKTDTQPTNQNPHHKPTNLINGSEQRRHGQHAWCDYERELCVPYQLHQQFQKQGLKTSDELKAWYPTVVAGVNGQPVGDLFAFWRVSFDNLVGTPVKKKSSGYETKGERVRRAGKEFLEIMARERGTK
jgi:hypothetical protein